MVYNLNERLFIMIKNKVGILFFSTFALNSFGAEATLKNPSVEFLSQKTAQLEALLDWIEDTPEQEPVLAILDYDDTIMKHKKNPQGALVRFFVEGERTPQVVKDIKDTKDTNLVFLTTRGPLSFFVKPHEESYLGFYVGVHQDTAVGLQEIGIPIVEDFAGRYTSLDSFYPIKNGDRSERTIMYAPSTGTVYTDGTNKAFALFYLLRDIDQKQWPQHIAFADDQASHGKAMEQLFAGTQQNLEIYLSECDEYKIVNREKHFTEADKALLLEMREKIKTFYFFHYTRAAQK